MTSELHPLEPFLPVGARLLMLGSFPPQRVRWSMDFFYPNLQNDMWRIVGLVFFGDKGYFLTPDAKRFDKERIVRFCEEKGLALYDTAEEIIRLKNNASDNFLQVVREVDLAQLLALIPECRAIVTTGQKASTGDNITVSEASFVEAQPAAETVPAVSSETPAAVETTAAQPAPEVREPVAEVMSKKPGSRVTVSHVRFVIGFTSPRK